MPKPYSAYKLETSLDGIFLVGYNPANNTGEKSVRIDLTAELLSVNAKQVNGSPQAQGGPLFKLKPLVINRFRMYTNTDPLKWIDYQDMKEGPVYRCRVERSDTSQFSLNFADSGVPNTSFSYPPSNLFPLSILTVTVSGAMTYFNFEVTRLHENGWHFHIPEYVPSDNISFDT